MANGSNRGWLVVSAGLGINLALGVLYSWTVIARVLALPVADGGWGMTASAATFPFAVTTVVSAAWMYIAGRIQDRTNPRWVVTAGGALVGAGLMVASVATPDTPWLLTIGFGLMVGSGVGIGNAPLIPVVSKWMSKSRRGLATGVVIGGMGLASAYIAPLTEWLIGSYGVPLSLRFLGAAFLVWTVSLAQFIVNPPQGYQPENGVILREIPMLPDAAPATRDYTTAEMLRTPQFYQLWVMYVFSAFAGLMVLGHMAKIAQLQLDGLNLGYLLVAVLAVGSFSGRVLGGLGVDKLGGTQTKMVVFIAQAGAMAMLWQAHSTWALVFAAGLIGVLFGTNMSVFPTVTSHFFGTKHLGANYGVLFSAWGVAGTFGAMVGGAIVDATGSYAGAYAVGATLSLAAAAIALVTREPAGR